MILPSQIGSVHSADTSVTLFFLNIFLEDRISLRYEIIQRNACEKIAHLTTRVPHRLFCLHKSRKKHVGTIHQTILLFFLTLKKT